MHALPIASCGRSLENEDIRVAVGLRLGAALCQAHQCPGEALLEVIGFHGLSCTLDSSKHSRHASINDVIYRACCCADISAVNESAGLTKTDGRRPDGSTIVPWSAGKCVLWDITFVDTMLPFHAAIFVSFAGLVDEQSSARKLAKYSELAISHIFIQIAIESFGPICAEALTFLNELERCMSVVTEDMRETTFLFQHLCIAIQRFNCILLKSSFIDGENESESFLFE